jgi:hypothetical protein
MIKRLNAAGQAHRLKARSQHGTDLTRN